MYHTCNRYGTALRVETVAISNTLQCNHSKPDVKIDVLFFLDFGKLSVKTYIQHIHVVEIREPTLTNLNF